MSKTKIVIINLIDSVKRRETILDNFKDITIPISVASAIDGRQMEIIDVPNIPRVKVAKYLNHHFLVDYTRYDKVAYPMNTGVIAASLSHMLVMNDLVNDKEYDNYIIFEDDARLLVSPEKLNEYCNNFPPDFDIIHMNNQSEWHPIIKAEKINDYYNNIVRRCFNCAGTYVVSKKAALKMLQWTRFSITQPPDDLISTLSTYYPICNIAIPNEWLFTRDDDIPSDVLKVDTNVKIE